MAFCGNCGTKLADDAKFCLNCGTPQAAFRAPAPVQPPVPLISEEDLSAPAAPVCPASPAPVMADPVEECGHPVIHHDTVAPHPSQERVYQYVGEGKRPVEHVNLPPQEPVFVPPVYNNTAYDAPKNAVRGEKVPLLVKKPLGFGKGLLVFLLCIVLLSSSLCAATVGTVRLATRPEVVTELICGISLSDIPAELVYVDAVDEDETLIEALRRDLSGTNELWDQLSDRELEQFIQEYVLGFAAEQINEFLDDIYSGTTDAELTVKDVEKLLRSSAKFLNDKCDLELTDEMIDELVAEMEADEVFDTVSMEYLNDEYGQIIQAAHIATSYLTLAIALAVALLCVLFIALLTRCPIRTMGSTGTVLLISSLVPGIVNLIPLVLPGVWLDIFGKQEYLADAVANLLATGNLIPLSVLGGSILLLVLRGILKSIRVRK